MRPHRLVAVLGLVGALACTGEAPAGRGPEASGTGPTSPRRSVRQAADPELRNARMQVATSWIDGGLASFCRADACVEDPGARPDAFVRAEDADLVAFFVARRPSEAEVAFVRAGSRRVAWKAQPHPSTYMAVEQRLPPGRYLVTLTARWGPQEARWLFGLRVP